MNSQFTLLVRIVLGTVLIVFGSNSFLHFIPLPTPTGAAADFIKLLSATKYIFPVVGILEVFIGIMLLLKKGVPFFILVLAPISINILLFYLLLDFPGVSAALIIALLNAILIYKYWKRYSPLFL
ncbi:DoxX family membrane protein [Flavobacterium psychrotolerans]|uniref:DoxX protein n=1 Tax=Flavobacterium psychrotolerans TaxID=2169410 RepID=A0A2U1JPY6_9FLAO|nr:DoxX family membrane protein [Flavobacterium psychrotolerans]PWA06898.1 DoxX protein [Flavobacterium psychrotolerans]